MLYYSGALAEFGEVKYFGKNEEKQEENETMRREGGKVAELESKIKSLETHVFTLKKQLFSSSLKVCNQARFL